MCCYSLHSKIYNCQCRCRLKRSCAAGFNAYNFGYDVGVDGAKCYTKQRRTWAAVRARYD